ncbi:hypothetical protein Bca4012_038682 [Brassica carinata]
MLLIYTTYKVNYSFIFGVKQGTELGYRQFLLVGFSIYVFALLCVEVLQSIEFYIS